MPYDGGVPGYLLTDVCFGAVLGLTALVMKLMDKIESLESKE